MTENLEARDEVVSAVAFIDLVKYTALTDVHGDVAGADAAAAIEEVAIRRVEPNGRLVKTAGDGVLVQAPDARGGLQIASEVIEDVHGLGLDARGGVHHGPVISRRGDIFGATVNLAARLAALAEPGMLAVTRPVAVAAAETSLGVDPRGFVEVSGLHDPVEIFTIDPCRHGTDWRADPVCGMRLDTAAAIVPAAIREQGIGFCSQRCADLYAAEPGRYAPKHG